MPAIAIICRQNVGKSSLFNRLIDHRKSIIYNQPGVTRDLIREKVPWAKAVGRSPTFRVSRVKSTYAMTN
ncbi:MAG: 50S ribosome-binding GTPase [Spirochaetes bacterium]|nr:50S ribosome-binding GTPase [Spirochaetota bacterium]